MGIDLRNYEKICETGSFREVNEYLEESDSWELLTIKEHDLTALGRPRITYLLGKKRGRF